MTRFATIAKKEDCLLTKRRPLWDHRLRGYPCASLLLPIFGVDLFEAITPEQTKFMTLLGILVLISIILSFIFRGAYFIDLGFSAFLLIFTIIKWHAEVLTHSEAPILGLAIIYFVFRLAIFFGEPLPKKRIAPVLPTEQNL